MWYSTLRDVMSKIPSRRVRKPPAWLTLAIAWCAVVGEGCDPLADGLPGGTECPIALHLSPVTTDGTRPKFLKLAVTNLGTKPVGWDGSFKAFLKWEVNYVDDTRVEFEEPYLGSDSSPADDELKQRFMTLSPGQTVTHTFDLDGDIEISNSAIPFGPHGHGPPVWFEGRRKYRFDSHADVVVRVRYFLNEADEPAFARRFGKDSVALEMTDKPVVSNSVVLKSR